MQQFESFSSMNQIEINVIHRVETGYYYKQFLLRAYSLDSFALLIKAIHKTTLVSVVCKTLVRNIVGP